jgi:hypothetical protein
MCTVYPEKRVKTGQNWACAQLYGAVYWMVLYSICLHWIHYSVLRTIVLKKKSYDTLRGGIKVPQDKNKPVLHLLLYKTGPT